MAGYLAEGYEELRVLARRPVDEVVAGRAHRRRPLFELRKLSRQPLGRLVEGTPVRSRLLQGALGQFDMVSGSCPPLLGEHSVFVGASLGDFRASLRELRAPALEGCRLARLQRPEPLILLGVVGEERGNRLGPLSYLGHSCIERTKTRGAFLEFAIASGETAQLVNGTQINQVGAGGFEPP